MISTERLIGALGHGKGYVDSINAVDKQYLKKIMMLIKSPNEENYDIKKISMHPVKREKHYSHADQCANFFRLNRSEEVQSNKKYFLKEKRTQN